MWRFPLVNDACISLRLVIGSKATMEFKPGHEYIYKVKITRTGVIEKNTGTPDHMLSASGVPVKKERQEGMAYKSAYSFIASKHGQALCTLALS